MLRTDGIWFKDETGRTRILRGVNLGGSTKVPCRPDGSTHRAEALTDSRQVSFVGRPFPLEEADEHFDRLRRWGLTFLRFLITWEAVEHEGPGRYDEDYLRYLAAVVRKAGEKGFLLFIDPHEDVWSRFSGGDGAPGWTLEAAGFDLLNLHASGAAFVHGRHHPKRYPRMIWPTNATKLAAATMFTLFFGSNTYAPRTTVEGEPIQEYLQRHYCAAMREVMLRLRGMPHVVGFDTMNEPFAGWIGWPDLQKTGGLVRLGDTPTPLQSMALGDGIPQEVDVWGVGLRGPQKVSTRLVNPAGVRAWRQERTCVWRENGVWDVDGGGKPRLLRPDWFARYGAGKADFARDFYRPFANRVAAAVREAQPKTMIFIEAETGQQPPEWKEGDARNIVFAPHWYDGLTLFLKRYFSWLGVDYRNQKPVFGRRAVLRAFIAQLRDLRDAATTKLGGVPTVIGEFGIPFDMNERKAYRTGNYRDQIAALDRSFQALDANLLSATLWNYTADNTHPLGDRWNEEDLSIFSRDDRRDPMDPDSGGRALEAAVRPYPMAVAGEPLTFHYDLKRRRFTFRYRPDPAVTSETELFVPALTYPRGVRVTIRGGTWTHDIPKQVLRLRADGGGEVSVVIEPA